MTTRTLHLLAADGTTIKTIELKNYARYSIQCSMDHKVMDKNAEGAATAEIRFNVPAYDGRPAYEACHKFKFVNGRSRLQTS